MEENEQTRQERLEERRKRAREMASGGRLMGKVPQTVTVAIPPEDAYCSYCHAKPDEPCITLRGKAPGRIRDEFHNARKGNWSKVPRFEEGETNELTEEGKAHEQAMTDLAVKGEGNPEDRLRYDPADSQRIPESGGYVTFLGQKQGVGGAYSSFMEPGHTFFAQWAPKTKRGFDKHGQYKVYFETPEGPVYLFPYEFVRLSPMHLLHLVDEGVLAFHPEGHAPDFFYDQIHYLQSRGISFSDAAFMVMDKDEQANIGWFEPLVEWDEQRWKLESAGLTPMEKEEMARTIEVLAQGGA